MEVSINTEGHQKPQMSTSVAWLLSKKRLSTALDVGVATIDRWASDPKNSFPAPLKIGPNRVEWTLVSIESWLEELAEQGGQS